MSHFNDYIFSSLVSDVELPELPDLRNAIKTIGAKNPFSAGKTKGDIWDPTGIAKNSETRDKKKD